MNRKSTSPTRKIRGATLFDFLATLFVFFVCSMLVGSAIRYLRDKSEDSQLHTSVQSINRAIYLFKTTGGDLSDALTPDQVIAKMRAAEEDEITLTLHSVFDAALKPVYDPPNAGHEPADRAFWNAEKQAFEVIETSRPGIRAFRESD